MFMPPTFGIMKSFDVLKQKLIPLVVISIISTVIIMAVTGKVTQFIIRKEQTKNGERSNL